MWRKLGAGGLFPDQVVAGPGGACSCCCWVGAVTACGDLHPLVSKCPVVRVLWPPDSTLLRFPFIFPVEAVLSVDYCKHFYEGVRAITEW